MMETLCRAAEKKHYGEEDKVDEMNDEGEESPPAALIYGIIIYIYYNLLIIYYQLYNHCHGQSPTIHHKQNMVQHYMC